MAKRHGNYKGNPNGVKFSKTVTKAVSNWKYNKDILNSVESAKELRKEINRVFHAANRRLQNIENSGVFSPAANAVNEYLADIPLRLSVIALMLHEICSPFFALSGQLILNE